MDTWVENLTVNVLVGTTERKRSLDAFPTRAADLHAQHLGSVAVLLMDVGGAVD